MKNAEAKKVLSALAKLSKPASGKEIAEAAGIDQKKVSSQINALKNEGLVESPVRCKYCLSAKGKRELS